MRQRTRSRMGLNALKARVNVRGLQAIDQRTAAAQALLGWRRDLLTDLGGETAVSAQQHALVEAAVRTRLYVDHLDAWILEHGSLVNARRRSVHPVVRERQQLVDSLARLLSLLGLERRQPKPLDLTAYLRERYGPGHPGASPPSPAQPAAPDGATAPNARADPRDTAAAPPGPPEEAPP
jgi:hypothetical protein